MLLLAILCFQMVLQTEMVYCTETGTAILPSFTGEVCSMGSACVHCDKWPDSLLVEPGQSSHLCHHTWGKCCDKIFYVHCFFLLGYLYFFHVFFMTTRHVPSVAFYVCNGNKTCLCTYYYRTVIIGHPLVLFETHLFIFCTLLHFYIYFVSRLKSVFIQSGWLWHK